MADVILNPGHRASVVRLKKPPAPSQTASAPATLRHHQKPPCAKPVQNPAVGALSRAVKSANSFVLSLRDGLTDQEREHQRKVEERRLVLCLHMQNAETRKQWQDAAEELDSLEGNEQWKLDSSTGDYNPELLEIRLKELDEARTNCDINSMMHLVRTSLSRDLGGMDNVDLYRHSYIGTKDLIERYVDSALKTVDALVEKSQYALPDDVSQRDVLETLLLARQGFGRSALLLSGGATFGMSHIGVLKALFDVNLLPRIISGASAGSIVCAVICTRTDEEIPDLIKEFPYGDLSVFDPVDRADGVFDHLRRLLTEGSWSDIQNLTRVMRGLLGDMTFQEAYNRTRRILNICVSTESIYELPRLLNYITAPNVMIWSAVAASCSVPLVFTAAQLLVKVPDTGEHMPWNPTPQRWIDGSVDNDLPMTRLAEMFNVNHFIVSQVNPHVVPFLAKDDHLNPDTYHERKAKASEAKSDSDWVYTITALARDEALHRLHFLAEMGVFPNLATKLRSVLSQKYSGDINILPEVSINDLPKLLSNPTRDFMMKSCLTGERATWPKLSRIRDRCAIELGLDRAVHRLRARVVFSASQVDLRRLATGIMIPSPYPKSSKTAGQSKPENQALSLDTGSLKSRMRRSSGSSIQLLTHYRRLMLENVLTDEETEEEERFSTRAKHGQGGTSPVLVRKPRLKRSAKSQSHFAPTYLPRSPMALSPATERKEFDFSKPPTPPETIVSPRTTTFAFVAQRAAAAFAPSIHLQPSEPTSVDSALSPRDDLETSERQSYSSDGDFDSRTDDSASETDPYDSIHLKVQGRRLRSQNPEA
ncbi:lipase [Plectosphaerella plurivora]|uniref:Patatin-like phospholipase domain-containing protein n=1 Tax=Plectosphaerella plurivora TaxID=936078 RepID=A0A9P8V2P1_9PEZI|nr:lipase [Plectosphaerella plurivora]